MRTQITYLLPLISLALVACGSATEEAEEEGSTAGAPASETTEPSAPELVDVELAGIGAVRLPADRVVVEQHDASESDNNIASARFTVGEGTEQVTIQAEGTQGRIGITDEGSARTLGRILTGGAAVQTVSQLDNGNFLIHSIDDSQQQYILVGNEDAYLKCATRDEARVETCRAVAGSLPGASG